MIENYENYFDKIFKEHTRGIEEHNFRHYNHAMGCMIYNKAHYKAEMKKRRMVPYEETERLAEQWDKKHPRKEYDSIDPRAMDIIKSLKHSADEHGNIKMGDRAINAMIEIGAISVQSEHIPTDLQGGFSA